MKTSESTKEISKALLKFQENLDVVGKGTKAYNYRYATLGTIWNSIKGLLKDSGVCVTQDAFSNDQGVQVTTRIMHSSGEWMEYGPLLIPMSKRDAHSTGSAISYARRYQLTAALGVITDDDDDGQAAQKKPKFNIGSWVDQMAKEFDKNDIENFLVARRDHFGLKMEDMVQDLSKNLDGFRAEISKWLKSSQ
jgi:hypothetical protein